MNSDKFAAFIAKLKTELAEITDEDKFVKIFRDTAANLLIDIDMLKKFFMTILEAPEKYGNKYFVKSVTSAIVFLKITDNYAVWSGRQTKSSPVIPSVPKYLTQKSIVHPSGAAAREAVPGTPINYVVINTAHVDDKHAREIQINLGVSETVSPKILETEAVQIPRNTFGLFVPDEPYMVAMPPREHTSYLKQYPYSEDSTDDRNGFEYFGGKAAYPIHSYPFSVAGEKAFRLMIIVGFHTFRYGKNSPTAELCNHIDDIEEIARITPEPRNVLPDVDANIITNFFSKNYECHRSYVGIVFVNNIDNSKDLFLRIKPSNSNDYYDIPSNTITFGQGIIKSKCITYEIQLVRNGKKIDESEIEGASEQYSVCKNDEDDDRIARGNNKLLMLAVYSAHKTSLGTKRFGEYKI